MELGIVTTEKEKEGRRRKKDEGAKTKGGPKFWPPLSSFT